MSKQEKSSAEEKIVKNLKAVLSQYHRQHMALAVKRGMLNRAKSGYAVGRPPLGYTKTETPGLFKLDENGLAIQRALKELANGKADTGMVVAYMEMFFHVMTGTKFPAIIVIEHFLSDPYYSGCVSYKGQLFEGLHEPLITGEAYQKLEEYLEVITEGPNSSESIDKSL